LNSLLAAGADGWHSPLESTMATPNYQFEKRRRELEKKAKKEEKRRHKLEAANTPQDIVEEPAEPAGDNPPPLDAPET
jgi:hypothetical protein